MSKIISSDLINRLEILSLISHMDQGGRFIEHKYLIFSNFMHFNEYELLTSPEFMKYYNQLKDDYREYKEKMNQAMTLSTPIPLNYRREYLCEFVDLTSEDLGQG